MNNELFFKFKCTPGSHMQALKHCNFVLLIDFLGFIQRIEIIIITRIYLFFNGLRDENIL